MYEFLVAGLVCVCRRNGSIDRRLPHDIHSFVIYSSTSIIEIATTLDERQDMCVQRCFSGMIGTRF